MDPPWIPKDKIKKKRGPKAVAYDENGKPIRQPVGSSIKPPEQVEPLLPLADKKRKRRTGKYEKLLEQCRVGDSFPMQVTTIQAVYYAIRRARKDYIILPNTKWEIREDFLNPGFFRVMRVQ